jgi:hypothetical protein
VADRCRHQCIGAVLALPWHVPRLCREANDLSTEKIRRGFFDWAKTSLDVALPRADVAGIECLSCLPPSREELDARGASSEEVAAVAAAPAAVAAAAPLLSSVETAKVLALAPSALVLLDEGVVEGERRAPYEGLYKLDRGNYVNQRPLFRRVEGGALLGASKRCLAYVAEGKCTWAGQLEASLWHSSGDSRAEATESVCAKFYWIAK